MFWAVETKLVVFGSAWFLVDGCTVLMSWVVSKQVCTLMVIKSLEVAEYLFCFYLATMSSWIRRQIMRACHDAAQLCKFAVAQVMSLSTQFENKCFLIPANLCQGEQSEHPLFTAYAFWILYFCLNISSCLLDVFCMIPSRFYLMKFTYIFPKFLFFVFVFCCFSIKIFVDSVLMLKFNFINQKSLNLQY